MFPAIRYYLCFSFFLNSCSYDAPRELSGSSSPAPGDV